MSFSVISLAAAVVAITPLEASAAQDYKEERNATVDAKGATAVEIVGRAGWLRVRGVAGLTEVRVRGTARTSEEDWLDEIKLVAERRGNVVVVEARMPNRHCTGLCIGNWHQSLDLEIEVPKGIAARVEDSSGEVEIFDVGELDLDDSSGDIELENIGGRVRVHDSSGEIRMRHITGDIEIEDNSGDIVVRDVTGSVLVDDDSSGEIDITRVSGTVHVRDDGSGSIDVRDIGGDFIVDHDGSGDISHSGVKGKVDVPQRKQRRSSRSHDDW